MAEYIEREAFRKMLVDRQITTNFFRPLERHEDGCIIEMLDETPAADVEPVRHGRWVKDRDGDEYCENCFRYMPVREITGDPSANDYCPNCGAKMDA